MRFFNRTAILLSASVLALNAQASLLGVWSDGGAKWIQFDKPIANLQFDRRNAYNPARAYDQNGNLNRNTNDDNYTRKRQYQSFDAEYLFYQYDKKTNMLSLGLQTGFNLISGVTQGAQGNEYLGDLRISFGNGIEYAVDFGLATKTTNGRKSLSGANDAGVYQTTDANWSKETYYDSGTFKWARTGGTKVSDLLTNQAGSATGYSYVKQGNGGSARFVKRNETSYFRQVSFNLKNVLGSNFDFTRDFQMQAAWTMSCLNDIINGHVRLAGYTAPKPNPNPPTTSVDAPGTLALFGLSLLTVCGIRRRKA